MNATTAIRPTAARAQDCAPFDVDEQPLVDATGNMDRVYSLAIRGVQVGEMIAERRAIDAAREAFWKRWHSGAPTDLAAIAAAKRAA